MAMRATSAEQRLIERREALIRSDGSGGASYRPRLAIIRAGGVDIRNGGVRHMLVDKLATAMHHEGPMRLKTYRDQNCSWHCDLVGKGNDPWSVDLIVESMSCVLLGGFAYATIALCIH
jgi:hypothetical protein